MKRCGTLSEALGITRGEIVALVGGGGKTGAMLRLIDELRAGRWRIVATTTTRVGRSVEAAVPVITPDSREEDAALERALDTHGAVFVAGGTSEDGKLRGIDPAGIERFLAGAADVILVEADGSRQMPIKAPADHEPVVPCSATLVVPMVGLDALGCRIGPSTVHRPELLRAAVGEDTVSPDAVARLIASPRGGMKGVPGTARVRPILNKVRDDTRPAAVRIARTLLGKDAAPIDRVVVADVASADFAYLERPGG